MARDLDEHQRRELSDFVNQLAEAAGYTTTAEWARDAGYPAPNLGNLRNGKSAVDGYNLLRLMRAASRRIAAGGQGVDAVLITADGEPVVAIETKAARRSGASTLTSSPDEAPGRLEALAGVVAELAEGQTRILHMLDELRGENARDAAPAAPPRAAPKRRREGSAR